jgi:hypothetical protein
LARSTWAFCSSTTALKILSGLSRKSFWNRAGSNPYPTSIDGLSGSCNQPHRKIVDIMKANVVGLAFKKIKTDVPHESEIERQAWRPLDNENAHVDGLVRLVALEIRDHVGKKRGEMSLTVPKRDHDSQTLP